MPRIVDSIFVQLGYIVDPSGLRAADTSMVGMQSRLGGIAAGLTTVVTLFAGLGAAAYGSGSAAEQAFVKLRTQVGDSAESVDRVRINMRSFSKETGQGLADLTNGFFALRSAGIEATKATEISEISSKAAAAQFGRASDISDLIGRVVTIYGDQVEPEKIADQFAASIRYGLFRDAGDLAANAPNVLPIAQQLGVSFGETMAALSSLSLVLPTASQASTSLRGILTEFLNPTAQARVVFEQFGITADQVRSKLDEGGIIQTLQWLWEALGQDQEQLGKIIERTEALNGALVLVGENAARARDIETELAKATGLVNEAFEIQSETTTFKLQVMMNKLSLTLERVFVAGAPLVDFLSDLPDELVLAVAGFTALQAVFMMFSMGAGGGLLGVMAKGIARLILFIFGKSAATIADTAATTTNVAAQRAYTGAMLTGRVPATRAATAATRTNTVATNINTVAAGRGRLAIIGRTAAMLGSVAATAALTSGMVIGKIASLSWVVSLFAAKGILIAVKLAVGGLIAAITALGLPVIAVIAAVVALGIAFYIFRDQVKEVVGFLLRWLRSNWPLLGVIFIGPWALVGRAIWGIRDQILDTFQSIWNGAVYWFGRITGFIGGVFNWIGDRFDEWVAQPIWRFMDWAGNLVGNWAGGPPDRTDEYRRRIELRNAVPVGATHFQHAPAQNSVNIDSVNVNVEHGDSTEIAKNVGTALEEESRHITTSVTTGRPTR